MNNWITWDDIYHDMDGINFNKAQQSFLKELQNGGFQDLTSDEILVLFNSLEEIKNKL